MNATTTAPARIVSRGTGKAHRNAGIDLSKPVIFAGYSTDAPCAAEKQVTYARIEMRRDGGYGFTEGTEVGGWLGGVATKFWLIQDVAAAEPVAVAEVELVAEAAEVAEEVPVVETVEVAQAEGDELDSLTFAQLMEIAKALKVPGRGVARINGLREGIRAVRAAA